MITLATDIPTNAVTIAAIIALVVLGALCVYKDINHGLILGIATFIAGLAGYKIRDTTAQNKIKELEQLIESLTQDKT